MPGRSAKRFHASFNENVTVRDLGSDTRIAVEGYGAILAAGVSGKWAETIDATDFLLMA